jgi:lipopolysaccharide/colanic/teichoic acid biosynthesis glycosyltransferase
LLFLRRPRVVPIRSDESDAAYAAAPGLPAISVAPARALPAPLASRSKRAFDVVFGSAILIVALPVVAVIAVAIRATSPGPVLFRQRRVGVDGKPFTLLKFRTMHDGVSEEMHEAFVAAMVASSALTAGAGAFKIQEDPRVTGIGRWLRRLSLDEVPQLINVLRGEMSIVGPRPPLAYEVRRYEPWQRERLSVRPGLTGLWQVSGRNRLTYVEMCHVDVDYIRGWSFLGDLAIVARTPWVMFVDRGGAE